MIERFREIFNQRYHDLGERKKTGCRIVGWMCLYVPEEILAAAGILPIRILGGAERTPQADAYLYTNACSFVRSCLEEVLNQRYDFLDGLVVANTCDHVRRLYDVWYQYRRPSLTHIISLPHKLEDSTLDFYTQQLYLFKTKVEDFSGRPITDRDLNQAIMTYNQTRRLLHRLYNLQTQDPPPITGTQILEILRAAMVMPKEEFNPLLAEFLDQFSSTRSADSKGARLLILGSELDDPEYLKIIEDSGALVVADDLCMGSRYFWKLVEPDPDPIRALARRYLTNVPCPRIRPDVIHREHLKEMIDSYRVEGVIYQAIKFCDIYGIYYPVVKDYLNEMGIPILGLEREYSLAGIGQLKTRVQAFLESLEG